MKPLVAAVAVLVALAVGAQAQTPEIDALRAQAAQGVAEAQYNLGVIYANGHGVPQDFVQAHLWYNLAAARQWGEAIELAVKYRDIVARSG